MAQTLEERVEKLERTFSELSERVLGLREPRKDWRATAGTLQNDLMAQQAARLGLEYRKQQTPETELAGS